MQKNNQKSGGFTLIEVLVVVLIIGILTSVALPQYQKAVEKSRATEAISYIDTWITAQQLYYMANGEFTEDISSLDIALPETLKYFSPEPAWVSKSINTLYLYPKSSSYWIEYVLYVNISADENGKYYIERSCFGNICQSIVNGLGWNVGTLDDCP